MGLISRAYNYVTGQKIKAAENNANEIALYNLVNGNLENANIKVGAGINFDTKLAGLKYDELTDGGSTALHTHADVGGVGWTELRGYPMTAGVILGGDTISYATHGLIYWVVWLWAAGAETIQHPVIAIKLSAPLDAKVNGKLRFKIRAMGNVGSDPVTFQIAFTCRDSSGNLAASETFGSTFVWDGTWKEEQFTTAASAINPENDITLAFLRVMPSVPYTVVGNLRIANLMIEYER